MLVKRYVVGGTAGISSNRLSRRRFLKLGGAGLAGAAMLGISGCDRSQGALVFSWWGDPVVQDLMEEFNEQKGSGFRVAYRIMPEPSGGYFDELKARLDGGGADVTVADCIWTAELVENGWISDLTSRFPESEQDKFLPGAMGSLSYEGGVHGVPLGMDVGLLYCREDLLEKSGFSDPPATWEELGEQARKVMRDQDIRYGYVFQGASYEGGVCNGLEFIWTHGGHVLDPDDASKVIIASPEAVAGLRTERNLVASGLAPPAVASFTEDESSQTFLNGDAVFCRHWPLVYAVAGVPEISSITPGQVGVSPLPVGNGHDRTASCIGGWNLMISASSDMQDEAWEFVRFLTSEESLKERPEAGGLPPLKALYDDREVLEEALPVISQGREALENARARPVSPHYSEMSLKMSEQFNAVITDATTPEAAVETLQAELQQIIERGE